MRRLLLLVLLASAVAAPAALGAGGITPLAPLEGDTIPAGKRPTFKLRVKGKGAVFVRVCRSRKRNRKGVICAREAHGKAKRKSGARFEFRPPFFDYPGFWLNTPGTYYWQGYRVWCDAGLDDCLTEGPVVKFRVG